METGNSVRGNWIENLENRVLLSATNIVGTFTGPVNDSNPARTGTLTFVFTHENSRGALIGTGSAKYPHVHASHFTLTGKIRGDGISMVDNSGIEITAVVTRSHHENIITGKFTNGEIDSGTFTLTEVGA